MKAGDLRFAGAILAVAGVLGLLAGALHPQGDGEDPANDRLDRGTLVEHGHDDRQERIRRDRPA